MGRDAGVRDASTLEYVRSRSVGGLSSSRRAWCPQSRCTTSPPRPRRRLCACRERGASHETDREVFQRSDGIRRCLPGSHDRNACRSLHSHDRPGFSSLPSAQPPGRSLCDSRMICKLVWQGAGSSRSSRAPASSGLSRVHALPNRWPFPPLSNPQFIGRLKIEPKLGCRAQVTC